MAAPIPGEQFVRTLRHYLEANQSRLLVASPPKLPATQEVIEEEDKPSATNTVNEPENGILKAVTSLWQPSRNNTNTNTSSQNSSKDSASSKPSSLYGIPIPYMSLLAATSPNATSLSNTLYMPPRSSLTLDIHYLYFLLVQFEYMGLEDTQLPVPAEHGLIETETTKTAGQAPSLVSSVGSVMSTLSLSTGWQFWSNKGEGDRPLHEDVAYIHRYLSKITALKLHMNILTDTQKGVTRSGQRTIRGYETPLPQDGSISLPLTSFKNLAYLELNHIHPSCIANWPELKGALVSLVIKAGNVDNAVDVIGDETPWSALKMLSLADNSLTTLDPEPAALIRSVTHLNLSSNLLIDVPAALASLYNLTSLNLSYNMISFTTGINTVLGNIQELDLRGNRLTLLAGLDRLWALERLDVRDNRIDDSAEIGRLTALPNIMDIWVEGNPFTKLQPNYRVDIFNAFKSNDQDIQLDGTKPTYGERRRIHGSNHAHHGPSTPNAVVEEHPTSPLAARATTKWPSAINTNNDVGDDHSVTSHSTAPPALIPKAKKLARAKTKGNKRIIRLGQIENKNEPPIAAAGVLSDDEDNKGTKYVHRLAELEDAVQEERVMARRAASVRSRRSKKAANEDRPPLVAESASESTRKSNDSFRRRIEAMRKEAGTEWLRVLQEMDVVKKQNSPTVEK